MDKDTRNKLIGIGLFIILVFVWYSPNLEIPTLTKKPESDYMTEDEIRTLIERKILAAAGGGVTDHSGLTGLGTDDHPQYLLGDGTESWINASTGVSAPYFEAHGVQTDWIKLGDENRSTWPSAVAGGGVEELGFDYMVFKNSTATYLVSGDTGEILSGDADDDVLCEYLDGTASAGDLVYFKSGNYLFDSFSKDTAFNIKGSGDATLFNLTNPNWSIDINADTEIESIQLYSNQDGYFHMKVDGSAVFDDVFFNFPLACTAEVGVIRFQGGSDGYIEFRNGCRLIGGDGGEGGDKFTLLSSHYSVDHIFMDDFVIESIDVGYSGYARIILVASDGWFNTVRLRDIYVNYWEAGASSDSALIYGPTEGGGTTLIVDGFYMNEDAGNFSDANDHQISVTDAIALNQYISNVHAYYRPHCYAGLNYTKLTDSILKGDMITHAAFDFQTRGGYPKEADVDNFAIMNGSLTFNSDWARITATNLGLYGSRIGILDEKGTGNPKDITIQGNFYHNDTDHGPDKYHYVFSLQQAATNYIRTLKVHDSTIWGYWDIFQGGTFTNPIHIIFHHSTVGPKLSTDSPTIFDMGARDSDDQIIWMDYCLLYTDDPPLDGWNPIRVNDRLTHNEWVDIDTDITTYSEYVSNFTIASGTSSIAVNHHMPTWSPWTNFQLTLTTDPANCTTPWATWESLTDTQQTVYIGDATGERTVNDDVDGIMKWELKP